MKEYDYDKINDEVFRRADAVKRKSAARKRMFAAVVTPMCCLILVCAVCIPVLSNSKDRLALQEAEYGGQEAEYAGDAVKGEIYWVDSDLSDNASPRESEAGDTQLRDSDLFAMEMLDGETLGDKTIYSCSNHLFSPTLFELIKAVDDIVLVSIVKSTRLSGENEAGEKEIWCSYYLRVLSPYKGRLKEGDVFSLTVKDDSIRKPGNRMLCFLREKDGGGYSLAFGSYGFMREKVYHDGFMNNSGKLSLKLEELPELIKRTEEE